MSWPLSWVFLSFLGFLRQVVKADEPGGDEACHIRDEKSYEIDFQLIGGQGQRQAGDAAGGGSYQVVGLPGTSEGPSQAGCQKGAAQGQGNAIDQGLADSQHAHGQGGKDGFLQMPVFGLEKDCQAGPHLSCSCHGQDGQQQGDAVAGDKLRMDGRQSLVDAQHDHGQEGA